MNVGARREEGKVSVLGSRDGLGLRVKITLSFLRSSLHDIPTHPCRIQKIGPSKDSWALPGNTVDTKNPV